MSDCTSLRGKTYEESIKAGFVAQNRSLMQGGEFELAGEVVMEHFVRKNGTIGERSFTDIDAQFVATQDFLLHQVMPVGCFCHEPNFPITAGTHVQLECITTEGSNLTRAANTYMQRKVQKHADLVFRDDLVNYQSEPGADYVLIFLFNGADHALVHPRFKGFCAARGVRGTTVFMPSSTADKWEISVQLNNTRFRVCREMLQLGMGHLIPTLIDGMTQELAIAEWGHAALGLPVPGAGL